MNREILIAVAVASSVFAGAACSAGSDPDDGVELGESNDEIRQKNVACRSPRLTSEGYRGEGSFVGDDGQVYVRAKVCMQDDDTCEWAQCDKEEGGGDWNGGPKGDWYGFWDTGEPMRGPCTVKIALARCGGGGGGGGGGANPTPTGEGLCKTLAHGRVPLHTCFQEPDWKWYRCDAPGVTNGAAGPNAEGCTQTLWYQQ